MEPGRAVLDLDRPLEIELRARVRQLTNLVEGRPDGGEPRQVVRGSCVAGSGGSASGDHQGDGGRAGDARADPAGLGDHACRRRTCRSGRDAGGVAAAEGGEPDDDQGGWAASGGRGVVVDGDAWAWSSEQAYGPPVPKATSLHFRRSGRIIDTGQRWRAWTVPSGLPTRTSSAWSVNRPCSTTPRVDLRAVARVGRSVAGRVQSRRWWPSSVTNGEAVGGGAEGGAWGAGRGGGSGWRARRTGRPRRAGPWWCRGGGRAWGTRRRSPRDGRRR